MDDQVKTLLTERDEAQEACVKAWVEYDKALTRLKAAKKALVEYADTHHV